MIQRGLTKLFVAQLRAARGLLGWSQTTLASRAKLSLPTVKRVESPFGLRVSDDARAKLRKAVEAAGIEFIEENGAGAGVRFRKPLRFRKGGGRK